MLAACTLALIRPHIQSQTCCTCPIWGQSQAFTMLSAADALQIPGVQQDELGWNPCVHICVEPYSCFHSAASSCICTTARHDGLLHQAPSCLANIPQYHANTSFVHLLSKHGPKTAENFRPAAHDSQRDAHASQLICKRLHTSTTLQNGFGRTKCCQVGQMSVRHLFKLQRLKLVQGPTSIPDLQIRHGNSGREVSSLWC